MLSPRSLGIPFPGIPGLFNAITDVSGVEVGYTTLISGEGPLVAGKGPVRTGVTAVLPRGKIYDPVFAGASVLNGNGEMTGAAWIEESGFLETPIMLTNSHSVGVVRDAAVAWMIGQNLCDPLPDGAFWLSPVVGETYDGYLNDINGFHVTKEHAFRALDAAAGGEIAQGNIGGGTGMICHGFKGGTGSASRMVKCPSGKFTLGVLVQANHGMRRQLTIAGVPVGQALIEQEQLLRAQRPSGEGSIVVIVATDAPFLSNQLKRLSRRAPMGIARVGGIAENTSGDLFLAFSTANSGAAQRYGVTHLTMLPNDEMTPFFEATVQATEEAIVNALFAAESMTGINGNRVAQLPIEQVLEIVNKKYMRKDK